VLRVKTSAAVLPLSGVAVKDFPTAGPQNSSTATHDLVTAVQQHGITAALCLMGYLGSLSYLSMFMMASL
jgi:hypothetical protein